MTNAENVCINEKNQLIRGESMANKCMNCKADLREGAKFCQACGTKVPLKQKSKITQAKFCIKCGAPLKKGLNSARNAERRQ